LVVVGLLMLGFLQSRLSLGSRFSTWLEEKARGKEGIFPAYLMGAAFSFTFCPTLFWLFFGLTIPLAVASSGGLLLPGVFAIGTAVPVLALAGLLASGVVNVRQFVKRFKRADVWLQRAVGLVFVLIGLHEIVLYWLI
jgi:cytochrome c biogenesis protein CcdA